jgi:hypothetical protein
MRGGLLHVPKRNSGVEGGGDEGRWPPQLVSSELTGRTWCSSYSTASMMRAAVRWSTRRRLPIVPAG